MLSSPTLRRVLAIPLCLSLTLSSPAPLFAQKSSFSPKKIIIGDDTGGGGGDAPTFTVFRKTYMRLTGAPVTVTDNFSVLNPTGPYTLRLTSGVLSDPIKKKLSSATISLNGIEIVDPKDFHKVPFLEIPVHLTESNTLSVKSTPSLEETLPQRFLESIIPLLKSRSSLHKKVLFSSEKPLKFRSLFRIISPDSTLPLFKSPSTPWLKPLSSHPRRQHCLLPLQGP